MKTEFVSVVANGVLPDDSKEIILSVYGPQGGTKGHHSLSVENAEKLVAALQQAIPKLKASP